MKAALAFIICTTAATLVRGGEFKRSASFDSVSAFVAAAKSFRAAEHNTDMSALFTMPEEGQPDEADAGRPVVPEKLESCEVLWSDDEKALVFATAKPKTQATNSAVGVLFYLSRWTKRWIVSDLKRFSATGKYAKVSAELTAGVGTGYHLGREDGFRPIVTIQESHGGRGYQYLLSASYTIFESKLQRLDLE